MAVAVRLGARGVPQRMAAACFPIASTPVRAFGGLYHRVTQTNGMVPQPAQGPPTSRAVPPGPTPGHSAAVPVLAAQWSIVRPSLPRVLPGAGQIPHGIPGRTYTVAVTQPGFGVTPITRISGRPGGRHGPARPRTPTAQARVTTAPRPLFSWKRQGG